MKAFEKSKDLIDRLSRMDGYDDSIDLSKCEFEKQCALIAVDEIIRGIERAFDEYEKHTGVYVKNRIFYYDFYEDVKHEIKNL
jgi:hypothetical protein